MWKLLVSYSYGEIIKFDMPEWKHIKSNHPHGEWAGHPGILCKEPVSDRFESDILHQIFIYCPAIIRIINKRICRPTTERYKIPRWLRDRAKLYIDKTKGITKKQDKKLITATIQSPAVILLSDIIGWFIMLCSVLSG